MTLGSGYRALLMVFAITGPLAMMACGDAAEEGDGDGDKPGGDGSGSSDKSGAKCYGVDVNTAAGGEACGSFNCGPGEYCADGDFCQMGCVATITCPTGQYCDPSASDTDPPVGTCRVPGPEAEVSCGGSTANKPCGALCEKFQACVPDTTDEQCDTLCVALSATCIDCLLEVSCTAEEGCEAECGS